MHVTPSVKRSVASTNAPNAPVQPGSRRREEQWREASRHDAPVRGRRECHVVVEEEQPVLTNRVQRCQHDTWLSGRWRECERFARFFNLIKVQLYAPAGVGIEKWVIENTRFAR